MQINNAKIESYVNRRGGVVKNGGCTISWRGHRLAYLYAIVDTAGGVVKVKTEGLFKKHFEKELADELITVMQLEEDKDEQPRNLYYNAIDSPIERY